jgi:hypothetical protein
MNVIKDFITRCVTRTQPCLEQSVQRVTGDGSGVNRRARLAVGCRGPVELGPTQ